MSSIKWKNVIVLGVLHCYSISAAISTILHNKWNIFCSAFFYQWLIMDILGLSTTICAHRFYTHRSFKMKKPLEYFFLLLQTASAQDPIISWVRDHRCHHKFTDTNADPYNSRRGFFFSHIGWLLVKKHPDVYEAGKKIDLSDVENRRILQIQKKYYAISATFLNLLLVLLTSSLFNLSFAQALSLNIRRYVAGIHFNFFINSFAHWTGSKPFDKSLSATDSKFLGPLIIGEGWHNFHHVFPSDYRTSETRSIWLNFSTVVIDLFAKFGWIYDRKETPREKIIEKALKCGDGSFRIKS